MRRTGSAIFSLDVTYSVTSGGTATSGADYQAVSGTLHWDAGERGAKSFVVQTIQDSIDEPPETLILHLTSPTGHFHCQLPADHTLTINDDDPNVGGSMRFTSAAQSFREDQTATVTVERFSGTLAGASVHYATVSGTAHPGFDHVPASGTLTFGTNELAKSFTVTLVDDTLHEPTESFSVALSSPGGGASLGSPAVQTLNISDGPNGDPNLLGDGFESGNLLAWQP